MRDYGRYFIGGTGSTRSRAEPRTRQSRNGGGLCDCSPGQCGRRQSGGAAAPSEAFPSLFPDGQARQIELLNGVMEAYRAREGEIMAALTEEMRPAYGRLDRRARLGSRGIQAGCRYSRGIRIRNPPGRQHAPAQVNRRRRAHHSMELAQPAHLQQARVRLRSGLPSGAQAQRIHAGKRGRARRGVARCRRAEGCVQPRPRRRTDGGSRDKRARGHRDRLVHRLDAGRFGGGRGPSVKRVAQELGGKSANIVLPDADLRESAKFQVSRGFSNTGRSCHSPTRLLVHRDQQHEMLRHLAEFAAQVRVATRTIPRRRWGQS